MMVAVLLGALSLGACVDDNESASVTNIRDAKAEQLRAMAALSNAQAEAESLIAAAEAQLRQAEAALKQAQASQIEEEIRQAQEEFNYEIAALQAKWEAHLAYWQSLKADYEGDLWANESENVQNAYNRYSTALNNVYNLNSALMQQQVAKAKTEAGVVTAQEAVERTINGWNQELIEEQRELAKLQEIQKATPSMEEYLTMMDDLEKQAYDIVNNKATTALAEETTTKNAYEDAYEAVEKGDAYAIVPAIKTLNAAYYNFVGTETENFAEDANDEFTSEYGFSPDGNFSFTAYQFVSTEIEANTLLLNKQFENRLEAADQAIEDATGKAWEKDKDGNIIPDWSTTNTVNGAQGAIDYYTQLIDQANKDIAAWQAQITAGQGDKTTLEGNITTARGQIKNYEESKGDYEVEKLKAQTRVDNAKADKAEIEAEQKECTDALAVLNKAENQKAYTDAVAALDPLAVAYVEAQSVAQEYENQLADLGFGTKTVNGEKQLYTLSTGSYAEIEAIVNGVANVQDLIDDCTEKIADLQAKIDMATKTGITLSAGYTYVTIYNPITGAGESIQVVTYTASTNGVTIDDALALIDLNIANITERLNIQQALVEKYKEQLNTLLGMSEGETPETPETPSEEQPAA